MTTHPSLHFASPHIDREITTVRVEVTSLQSSPQRVLVDSESPRKFGNRELFAAKRYDSIIAAIVLLLLQCGPSAVARLVVAVYINAIKRVTIRARPHIAQEGREIMDPFGAHGDTSPSVAMVATDAWHQASTLRVAPCAVFGGMFRIPLVSACVAVKAKTLCVHLCAQAVAACALAAKQIARIELFLSATVTATNPAPWAHAPKNNKTAIALPGLQFLFGHMPNIPVNTHNHNVFYVGIP